MQQGPGAATTQELLQPAATSGAGNGMFVALDQQLANVRRWNEDLEWGFSEEELDGIDITATNHPHPLIVDVIVPYLDDVFLGDDDVLDGVRRTCHELWSLAAEQQAVAWSFDWLWAKYYSRPKPVRLLPGIVHGPGLRRVTLDLGAHWKPGRHVRPRQIRGPNSANAEVLAAAAHFPEWASAMDGRRIPFVWLGGYQVTFPECSVDNRLLSLAFVRYRHALSLSIDWADHSHPGFAAPVCLS